MAPWGGGSELGGGDEGGCISAGGGKGRGGEGADGEDLPAEMLPGVGGILGGEWRLLSPRPEMGDALSQIEFRHHGSCDFFLDGLPLDPNFAKSGSPVSLTGSQGWRRLRCPRGTRGRQRHRGSDD